MASGKVGRRLPALRPAQHPPSESTCRWGSALGTWEVVEAAVFWARPAAVRNEGTPEPPRRLWGALRSGGLRWPRGQVGWPGERERGALAWQLVSGSPPRLTNDPVRNCPCTCLSTLKAFGEVRYVEEEAGRTGCQQARAGTRTVDTGASGRPTPSPRTESLEGEAKPRSPKSSYLREICGSWAKLDAICCCGEERH